MGRGPLSIVGMGKGGLRDKLGRELSHGVGYLTGANAMEDMAEQQEKLQAQQLAQAQRQAYEQAGAQVQTTDAGTQTALAKILQKRSALQRSIRTQGQQRLGD